MVFTDEGKEILYTFTENTVQGINHYIVWADTNWKGEDALGSKVVSKSYYEKINKILEVHEREADLLHEKYELERQKELEILRNT